MTDPFPTEIVITLQSIEEAGVRPGDRISGVVNGRRARLIYIGRAKSSGNALLEAGWPDPQNP